MFTAKKNAVFVSFPDNVLLFISILVSSILIYLFTVALADTKKLKYKHLHNYFFPPRLSEPTHIDRGCWG